MINAKVCIIALGWLGNKLYDFFDEMNTCGSYFTCSKNKKNEFQFDFKSEILPPEILQSDIIILNLPPSKLGSLDHLQHFLTKLNTKKIVFISSTSVFGSQGNIDEDTNPIPDSENGKFLLTCENLITQTIDDYIIIRPAGLYGETRHPGKYLAGRSLDMEGGQKVNLIEQNDLVNLIIKSLKQSEIKLIHAVSTDHPTKKEYYQSYCLRNHLSPPTFKHSSAFQDKIINTKYTQFQVSTPLA